jgi:hypothetical protein
METYISYLNIGQILEPCTDIIIRFVFNCIPYLLCNIIIVYSYSSEIKLRLQYRNAVLRTIQLQQYIYPLV